MPAKSVCDTHTERPNAPKIAISQDRGQRVRNASVNWPAKKYQLYRVLDLGRVQGLYK